VECYHDHGMGSVEMSCFIVSVSKKHIFLHYLSFVQMTYDLYKEIKYNTKKNANI